MATKSDPVTEPVVVPPVTPTPSPDAPAHTGDGEPGALPVDVPDEWRPNPPASPGYGADPAAVAETCAAAGFPELTAGLLRSRASMTAVVADIDRAKAITEAAKLTGQAGMAKAAIVGGVSLDTFREMAFAAKAGSQQVISTGVLPVTSTTQTQAPINSREVNERKNAQQGAVRH